MPSTRCTCRWVRVEVDPALADLLLRETDDADCAAHASTTT